MNMRDELRKLAEGWRSQHGDYPESKLDCAYELEAILYKHSDMVLERYFTDLDGRMHVEPPEVNPSSK